MTPERLAEARQAHGGCEKPDMCLGCGLLEEVDRLREAAAKAIRLIEEAPFAHPKLTEAQTTLMAARDGWAALSSGGAP